MFYDYAESGSWTERTFRRNEEAFTEIRLRQRVAKDISQRSVAGVMLGESPADAGGIGSHRAHRYAACQRRDSGGTGGGSLWRAVYPIDHEHLFS